MCWQRILLSIPMIFFRSPTPLLQYSHSVKVCRPQRDRFQKWIHKRPFLEGNNECKPHEPQGPDNTNTKHGSKQQTEQFTYPGLSPSSFWLNGACPRLYKCWSNRAPGIYCLLCRSSCVVVKNDVWSVLSLVCACCASVSVAAWGTVSETLGRIRSLPVSFSQQRVNMCIQRQQLTVTLIVQKDECAARIVWCWSSLVPLCTVGKIMERGLINSDKCVDWLRHFYYRSFYFWITFEHHCGIRISFLNFFCKSQTNTIDAKD